MFRRLTAVIQRRLDRDRLMKIADIALNYCANPSRLSSLITHCNMKTALQYLFVNPYVKWIPQR